MKKKVLVIFGTRPEAIKMVPVIKELQNHEDSFEVRVCITAQHRQMLDQILSFFNIIPDYDLDLMKIDQDLFSLTADIILGIKNVLNDFLPDLVLVHGDTTTAMASALASFYNKTRVCHVEAGLRTYNKNAPYPEEVNRQIISKIADRHYAPTEGAKNNLLRESVEESSILVTGNTVIDALMMAVDKIEKLKIDDDIDSLKDLIDLDKGYVLVTGHRRENFGDKFLNICEALKELAIKHDVQIVYPVHLNPSVQEPVNRILGLLDNVKLVKPQGYKEFVWLMKNSKLIITDSGGVQEEAPSLGKPVLVMRDVTEREEVILSGDVILVGTDKTKIIEETCNLLSNRRTHNAVCSVINPYGKGNAAKIIVNDLLNYKY